MGAWELLADATASISTQEFNITGLNITTDDLIMIRARIVNGRQDTSINLYPNVGAGDRSNFTWTRVTASGGGVSSGRANIPHFSYNTGTGAYVFSYFKLLRTGKAAWFNDLTLSFDAMANEKWATASRINISAPITQLKFRADTGTGVGAGSHFQVYRLAAEKVGNIVVPSNINQINFSNLNFTKQNEYLLIMDAKSSNSSGAFAMVNNNTTRENYWAQRIYGNGSEAVPLRLNYPATMNMGNVDIFNLVYLKLLDSGYYMYHSYGMLNPGSTGLEVGHYSGTSTFTMNQINDLNVKFDNDLILSGSRFELYKLY